MSQKKKEQHWASTSRYDTGELLRDLDGGADTYSLEEILAEYGHGGVEDLTLPEEQEAKAATESAQEPVREQKAAPRQSLSRRNHGGKPRPLSRSPRRALRNRKRRRSPKRSRCRTWRSFCPRRHCPGRLGPSPWRR